MDGAAKGSLGLARAGGVLRNDRGGWILGFSENLGHCTAIKAEIRAILRGLQLTRELGTIKLCVQVDSKAVVSMLTTTFNGHPEYGMLIQQCKYLLDWGGWEIKISHCFREANQVADKLAKMGVEGNLGVTRFCTPPIEVQEAMYADNLGVLWPRGFNR